MTNLKKTLAVVLAFAMILSMGAVSTFAAYSDVEAGTKVSEAVGILSNLGILTGFEDGTFKPEETVTRAQMAAIICRTLGYEDQAQSSMGTTVFNDVAADHWASGYVNVAQAQQIINGYGDGNYGPEDLVTYEQAVKMIVSALGYDLAANAKGGYPTGYLAIASAEGITKNANGRVGDAAARGTIAVLVYNSLEVRLMDQTSWSTGADGDKYGKTYDTILSKYLEVRKWEGIVTATPLSGVAGGTYDPDVTPKMNITGSYKYYNDKGEDSTYYGSTGAVDCSLVDVNAFLGKAVIAYVGFEKDVTTGNKMVYAIVEDSDNEIISLSGTQLIDNADDPVKFTAPGYIYYREVGSNKILDVELDSSVNVYVNYGYRSTLKGATTTANIANIVDAFGGKIELISNDNDTLIDTILVTAYQDETVIEEITVEEGLYMIEAYTGSFDEIDTTDEDEKTVIYKDGALVEADALAAGDTISSLEVADGLVVLFVSSATVTGAVESYSDDDVTIAGETYELSKTLYHDHDQNNQTPMVPNIAALVDEEGVFFLNVDGQIAWNDTDTAAAGNYGIVVAVDENDSISGGYVVQLVLANGTVAEYALNSTAKIKNRVYTDTNDADKDVYEYLKTKLQQRGQTTTYEATVAKLKANANDLLYKVTIKNDKISKLIPMDVPSSLSATSASTKYDEYAMAIGDLSFDESTVVFGINEAYDIQNQNTVIDADKIKVGTPADFFADDEDGYVVVGFDLNTKSICGAVIGYDLAISVPQDGAVVVVSDVTRRTYNDETAVAITGVQAGKEVSYIIYNEDDSYDWGQDPDDIEVGDVLLVAAANADGVVEDYQLLYDEDTALTANAVQGDTADRIYNGVGNLTSFANNQLKLDAAVSNAGGAKYAIGAGIPTRDTANYTLVDFTESTKHPEIDRKSAGSALFSTKGGEYAVKVFVRINDDKLVDVVVYRSNAAGTQQLPTPVIEVNGDQVTMSATDGATIYYTTDGSEPTDQANVYSGAITAQAGTTVFKAFAKKANYADSSVASLTVTVAAQQNN